MRRLVAGAALVGSLVLAVSLAAGCSSSDTAVGCGPNLPTVSGSSGSDPVISIPNGKPSEQLVVCQLSSGTDQVVQSNDYVLLNVEGKVWSGDRTVVDSFTNKAPQGLPLATAMPAWRHLAGDRVGSRVMMVVPPKDGFGSAGDPAASVASNDTLVFVFDVLSAVAPTATAGGTVVPYHPSASDPKVAFGPKGATITVPTKVKPPTNLTVTLLKRGTGPPIENGQTVVTQYTGAVWRSGKQFDSSWQHGFPESFVLGAGQVLPGWEQGLGGTPVGSRVLLVIPPGLAYGQSAQPPDINSGDTLVFVVDIVAAVTST